MDVRLVGLVELRAAGSTLEGILAGLGVRGVRGDVTWWLKEATRLTSKIGLVPAGCAS